MSHSYYGSQWIEAQTMLADVFDYEKPPDKQTPQMDKNVVMQQLLTMYIRYVQIFRRLENCYDQIVQPQKRRLLRLVLDGVMGRVLEIKNEMVQQEILEFQYFDELLSDLKLTPSDMEMPIPKYFIMEKAKVLKEREKILGQILARISTGNSNENIIELSVEDAIRLIQSNERARQGRLRAKFMRQIKKQGERVKQSQNEPHIDLPPEEAALRIQKVWRGMHQRIMTDKMRKEEMIFIGMEMPPTNDSVANVRIIADQNAADKRKTQDQHEAEYVESLVTIKEKLREDEGPYIKELLVDQIRQWFIECRDGMGKFPDFPSEEEGGSLTIFQDKDPKEVEREIEEAETSKNKKKDKKTDKKDKKNKKDKNKDKKGKKKKEDSGWIMPESKFIENIVSGAGTYTSLWATRDESKNFSQRFDAELIREEKRKEVEEEVRIQVDELMRQELKNLKLAIDRDKGKKGKKGKSGKKKGGKKDGGKKGKKIKDNTPDRTIDSIYEELVVEGILQRPTKISLEEFVGDYNYLGSTLKLMNIEPNPSMSDIRRLITEYAILPLGSQIIHERAPLIKSLMIAGPTGVGKKMLVHAICTETGANFFDITPLNLMGKYPGKDGIKLLLSMIFKVGRALQPSVIFIGECEKIFKKKIPKTDMDFESDPKRLKKDLPKSLKTLRPEDRILIVGTTKLPFEAEVKSLCSCFQKIILIPRPDYASRHLIWRHIINKHCHKHLGSGDSYAQLDVSSLSKISDGYTPGMIDTVCVAVLTELRVKQLDKKPLQAIEFISHLSKMDPIYKEEEEAYYAWWQKTPIGKKRAKLLAGDDDAKKNVGKASAKKKKVPTATLR